MFVNLNDLVDRAGIDNSFFDEKRLNRLDPQGGVGGRLSMVESTHSRVLNFATQGSALMDVNPFCDHEKRPTISI